MLLATTDHWSHGLFAVVERVVNQVLHARASGMEPYVWIGELVWAEGGACEHGTVPYHEASRGANVWDYWFEQPGRYRPGDASVGGRPVRSVQVVRR